MKTRLIISMIALFLLPLFAQATHLTGGYISYSVDPQNPRKYNFVYTLYTNRASSADDPFINFDMGDGNKVQANRKEVKQYSEQFDIKTFLWSYTYSANGNYTVSPVSQNREHGIINVPAPSDQNSFVVHTNVQVDQSVKNKNGVKLASTPLFMAYAGEEMHHNLIAYDVDGDELTYDLVVPRTRIATGESIAIAGYTFPEGLTIDKFGELRWEMPTTKGTHALAVKITEHRDGRVVGSTVVDFLLNVIDRTQQPRLNLVNQDRLTVNNDGSILARPAQPLKLEYFLQNAEGSTYALSAMQFSDLDTLDLASPVVAVRDSANGKAVTLTFTPSAELTRPMHYTIGMRGQAGVAKAPITSDLPYNFDWSYTYLIIGEQQPTGLRDDLSKAGFILYPNPIHDEFVIKAPDMPGMYLQLRDTNGRTVLRMKLQPGQNALVRPASLSSGMYFYTILSRYKPVGTGKLVVQ
ncbi:T9SS type A sorting domain-containing protein [Pontibacter rugosus]|uniref:T9SS type A sorting domain-containing protein n=1 Tax=Pontibacter rugosus TaxID=1745966 RepID=A0ABW3SL44_9BACT